MTLQVFKYIEQLDAFLIEDEFQQVADELGLTEWHAVVWMGRLFTMDEDYGEHWFDNWSAREDKEVAAQQLGIDSYDLMVLYEDCFAAELDGPCHSPGVRRAFWTQVLGRVSEVMLF